MGKTNADGTTYTDRVTEVTTSVNSSGEVTGVTDDGDPTSSLMAVGSDTETPVVADDDGPVDMDGDGQTTGYEVFTKADLVTECESRGLLTSGNKPDLVARLQEADKDNAEPAGTGA